MMSGIGERLRQVRESIGLDQVAFASSIGITSRDTISKWERGINFPPADVLATMREKHGISIEWLITGDGSMMAGCGSFSRNGKAAKERYRRIRSFMVLKGITFSKIARELNCTVQHVRMVVVGERESARVQDALIRAGIPEREFVQDQSGCEETSANQLSAACAL